MFYDTATFDLGNVDGQIHNHYDIVLKYHKRSAEQYRVVGVLVWPSSLARSDSTASNPTCAKGAGLKLRNDRNTKLYYTYSISWEESDTPWASECPTRLPIYGYWKLTYVSSSMGPLSESLGYQDPCVQFDELDNHGGPTLPNVFNYSCSKCQTRRKSTFPRLHLCMMILTTTTDSSV